MKEGLRAGEPEAECTFFLNTVHGFNAASESLRHVSAAQKGQAENAAGLGAGSDADLRKTVIDEEQLDEQGGIPADFHVGGSDPPEHRDPPVGCCCAEQADDGCKQDPRRASPQGQPGSFPIERQDVLNVSPIHCIFFLSKQMTDDCSQKKARQPSASSRADMTSA